MTTVTLSSKHQITLPVDLVRGLNLKPGDKLVVELIDDHLIVLPQPQSWVDYFAGSMKGVYGNTVEEVDRYIAEVRNGWELDGLKNVLAASETLRAVYAVIPWSRNGKILSSQIAEKTGISIKHLSRYLLQLVEVDAIKCVPNPEDYADPFYQRIP
ncbi:MAG: AbrB/MazE/SpoVT family DNA-binding domain-containing protein [Chloroflexi bacterium]|nr:AbrB/MazE/SpoVT family DNA-binding domain-containing protein [Chloroflexota bacterium]